MTRLLDIPASSVYGVPKNIPQSADLSTGNENFGGGGRRSFPDPGKGRGTPRYGEGVLKSRLNRNPLHFLDQTLQTKLFTKMQQIRTLNTAVRHQSVCKTVFSRCHRA